MKDLHTLDKPLTNADKIRAMTDEELAEQFVKLTASEYIKEVKAQSVFGGTRITETQIAEAIEVLRQSWLEWLTKPAEDNHDDANNA